MRNSPESGESGAKACKVTADFEGVLMVSLRSRMAFSWANTAIPPNREMPRQQREKKLRPG